MSSPTVSLMHFDTLYAQIQTATSITNLNQILKTSIREHQDVILATFLSDGQDPLALLDPRVHSLAILSILSVRLNANYSTVPPPGWRVITDFCRLFDSKNVQLAAERVTKVAKGIQRLANTLGNPSLAIEPLRDLVMRYPPSNAHLTTIHPIFLLTCVSTRHFSSALPVLANPITEIDTNLCPDLAYQDNLTYHYTGGIALAALKRWKEAEEFFEICVTGPGTFPAALQMEALKKLRLVQLIATGQQPPLPKYTHPQLTRLFKNTAYHPFANAYPRNLQLMREIMEKDQTTFAQDKNLGLLQQVIASAPRWVLKKLTATYVTLHLTDIARVVGLASEDEARTLLLSMIEADDITAQLAADGTVTFSDPPVQFTKAQVDAVLLAAQDQTALLTSLEQDVGKSKEFLNKVVKSSDSSWVPNNDEEIFANLGQQQWDDNNNFS